MLAPYPPSCGLAARFDSAETARAALAALRMAGIVGVAEGEDCLNADGAGAALPDTLAGFFYPEPDAVTGGWVLSLAGLSEAGAHRARAILAAHTSPPEVHEDNRLPPDWAGFPSGIGTGAAPAPDAVRCRVWRG